MANRTAPDLAVSAARTSRSNRSRSGVRPVGQPTVISRDFSRDIAAGAAGFAAGAGLQNLGASLSSFFQQTGQAQRNREQLEAAEAIRKENDILRREAEALAVTSPKKVEHALATGDWSAIPLKPDALSRADFIDTLRSLTGARQASDWAAEEEVGRFIAGSDDPDAARSSALEKQTAGMDPVQKQAFLSHALEATEQLVAETKRKNVFRSVLTLTDRINTEFHEDLMRGNIVTSDDYMTYVSKLRAATDPVGAKAQQDMLLAFDYELLEEAIVNGDTRALRLIDEPIAERGGLSLREIYREKIGELDDVALANVGKARSADHQTRLFGSYASWVQGEIGTNDFLKSLDDLSDEFGPTSQSLAWRQQAMTAVSNGLNKDALFASWLAGLDVPLSDMRTHQVEFFNTFTSRMEQAGITDPKNQADHLSKFLQDYPPSGDLKAQLGRWLRGDDPAKQNLAFTVLRTVPDTAIGTMLHDADRKFYEAGLAAERAGIPFPEGIASQRETDFGDTPKNKLFADHFGLDNDIINDQARKGAMNAVSLAEAEGWINSGETHLFGLIYDDIDEAEVPTLIDREHRRLAEEYLFLGLAQNPDQANTLASQELAKNLEVQLVGGNKTVRLRPRESADKTGKAIQAMTGTDIDRALSELTAPDVGFSAPTDISLAEARGGARPSDDPSIRITGLVTDRHTALGHGRSIQMSSEDGAADAAIVLDPGDDIRLSPERANSEMFKRFERVGTTAAGDIIVRVPEVSTRVGTTASWRLIDGQLQARYMGFDPDVQAGRLDAEGNAMASKGAPPPSGTTRARSRFFHERGPIRRQLMDTIPTRVDQRARADLSLGNFQSAENMMEGRSEIIKASDQRAEYLLDWGSESSQPFQRQLFSFIEEVEGFSPAPYKDSVDFSVGFGYNLGNPTAREDLKAVGLDIDKVRAKSQEVTRPQARQLSAIHLKRTARWMHKHFEGHRDKIPMHRWVALMSLAYNSRWNDRGPTLIGPGITEATINNDKKAAQFEIEENSSAGIPDRFKAGIKARRRKEFLMWLGQWQ